MAEDTKVFGMAAESGRWLFVIAGMIMNFCLGAIYAYSVIRVPLEAYYKSLNVVVTATNMLYPYIVFLLVFAITMPVAGQYIVKMGPKKVAMIGGVLTGLGWFLASTVSSPTMLSVTYGIVGGLGVGIAYNVPIQVSTRWFPDRRGLAVGLTVLGFGFSAALIAPIADFLVTNYGGILNTFRIFGVAFLIILVLLSMLMVFPPAGWAPKGWKPPEPKAGAVPAADFMRNEMVKTRAFMGLWICYTIGTLAGLMAIGVAKPVGLEIATNAGMDKVAAGALMTGLVIPFAACNGFGRPIFGWLTDRLTPRNAAILTYVLIILASLGVYTSTSSVTVYTIGFALLWGCLGGWLAIAPTATASYFGIKDNARNYGLVFTAYGAGAVIGNLLAGQVKDIFGAYTNVFPIVAVLALVGIIVAFVTMKPPVKKAT
ncbi:MAG TPA: OFA family MFS transporter [Methanothrix sp.]|nr:OFA family MFS transporter [Methanothrix sp.]